MTNNSDERQLARCFINKLGILCELMEGSDLLRIQANNSYDSIVSIGIIPRHHHESRDSACEELVIQIRINRVWPHLQRSLERWTA